MDKLKPVLSHIDLFAGIGGIRMGFEDAGFTCVFSSEWDKFARETYSANFSSNNAPFAGDITVVDVQSIPDHTVLTGGFPCQPFSLAGVSKKNSLGRAHGFKDETQGTLFFNIAQILDAKRPQAFVLENVRNLLSHDKKRTIETIMRVLTEDLGYRVEFQILDAEPFLPQKRKRVFIVGFRDHALMLNWERLKNHQPEVKPLLSSVLHETTTSNLEVGKYVSADGNRALDKYTLSDNLWAYLQAYADGHRAKGNGFGFGLVSESDVARTLSARYGKDGSEILVQQENKNPRRLTPRECARLMGFPDSFKIPVSDAQAYKQFGNSVPVPLVRAVAIEMRSALEHGAVN